MYLNKFCTAYDHYLTNNRRFIETCRKYIVDRIMRCDYNFDDEIWCNISKEAKDFISSCLQMNPHDRPCAQKALEADFLKKRVPRVVSVSTMQDVRRSIAAYAQCAKLKQLALIVIAHKSSMEEIVNLRRVFNKYDFDNDGVISFPEFKSALSDANYTDEEINDMFCKLVSLLPQLFSINSRFLRRSNVSIILFTFLSCPLQRM